MSTAGAVRRRSTRTGCRAKARSTDYALRDRRELRRPATRTRRRRGRFLSY